MKLTIITITYNSENTLEQTIKSVISQKASNVEYIIIDGGSSDQTLNIINYYRQDIDILVSEADKGISDAFNKGIKRASGDIIGIINSDDILYEGAAETVLSAFAEDSDIDVLFGNLMVFKDEVKKGHLVRSSSNLKKLRYALLIPHPCVFISRKAYKKYGLYSLEYKNAMDYELISRMYYSGAKFKYFDKILAGFREGGQSIASFDVTLNEHKKIAKRNGAKAAELNAYLLYVRMREYVMPFIREMGIDRGMRDIVQKSRKIQNRKKL